MLSTPPGFRRRRRHGWLVLAAAAALAAPAAHATDFTESADFSNNPAQPTLLGTLTPGSNLITGVVNTFGDRIGPNGERTTEDMDYVTFTIPTGYALTRFIVSAGTLIVTDERIDSLFLGLAKGNMVLPSNSASTLYGYTLVTQAQLGADILANIGNQVSPAFFGFPRDAEGFSPPVPAGIYTLWLYDGDERAEYSFNAVVTAAVPEPATWAMMLAGFGAMGLAMRGRRRARAAIGYA